MGSIYVDCNATVPVSAAHLSEMGELIAKSDGNPSSIHREGRNAKVALENARAQVAGLIGARAQDVFFTSGATESNNIVIQGVVGQNKSGKRPHVIITAAEHSSVIEPGMILKDRGECELDIAPVTREGGVNTPALLDLITPNTALVCLIQVNNETGAINAVEQIADLIKGKSSGTHIHVDAVQALGKIPLQSLAASKVDSIALSGHKVGAFKGVGALFVKSGIKLRKLAMGGGQERARRPGTENMPGILSFGLRARDLAASDLPDAKLRPLQDLLVSELLNIKGMVIHGVPAAGVANTVNFHVEDVPGDDILLNFDLAGISASSGSACSSGVGRPSHVLKAMGYSDWVALNSVRISMGARGCIGDVHQIIEILKETISRVQSSDAGNVREPSA